MIHGWSYYYTTHHFGCRCPVAPEQQGISRQEFEFEFENMYSSHAV